MQKKNTTRSLASPHSDSHSNSDKSSFDLSKIELNLRHRKFVSDDGISNLMKQLEIQLQRLDISISLDKYSVDPAGKIVDAVKYSVDEILQVRERYKMNSFISTQGEQDFQAFADINAKVTLEKLNAARTQLKHYERLLNKKEKVIIDKEEELNIEREMIEKTKEQLEITKIRLESVQGKGIGVELINAGAEDFQNIKALATRLASEKQEIEEKR